MSGSVHVAHAAPAKPPANDMFAASVDDDQPTDQIECAKRELRFGPNFLHSPPDSNNTVKSEASDSELSDLDDDAVLLTDPPTFTDGISVSKPQAATETPPKAQQSQQPQPQPQPQHESAAGPTAEPPIEDDIGEVLPDHWSGAVPVFKPTMEQFKDFNRFMLKVDSYGMKSGIIKVIPPKEWKDAQPPLDDLVKQVRVREPIKQDIMGSNGTYRQVNILHGRSYNIPQWRQLCEQSDHQPPARRGERRANVDKPKVARPRQAAAKAATKPVAKSTNDSSTPKKRGRGRPPRSKGRQSQVEEDERPMTPVSPNPGSPQPKEAVMDSIETDPGMDIDPDDSPRPVGRMGAMRQGKPKTQSTSARRKYSRREGSAVIDEAAFKDFDYRMDISEYTPERCEELERSYWKTLTYAQPLYGADMMGTLFDDRTESWNLNKLPNLLDVLGSKVPGVNTAYLYLGMWKATFAWHLEDVDLYSINYLHFGAPKQWYSISQADARRFEAAMKNIWPADAKACDQFLRHKAFLISPQHLLQNYNIKVNKVVSYPGEFVVTYPYGYHSGYNLGYNCAEAVNFALEPWLEMGKIAKKCECAQAQDSVWMNVYEIERKLRGWSTEYEDTEEEEEEDEDISGLPSPPASGVKFKAAPRKRKRKMDKDGKVKSKKIKLLVKSRAEPPCCLCPTDLPALDLIPTNDGRKAHRTCALYIPETFIDIVDGKEVVCNARGIHKDRLDLRCLFCRSKRGACFQCSQKKCARSYHATCAAAAGVFVEEAEVPVIGEDGTEYKEQAFEFSCRFHRTKRDKKLSGAALEEDSRIREAAMALQVGDICQMQYYRGDIFAGLVLQNRRDEETLLLEVLPTRQRVEVEWKWLLLADPADYHLPKASANAIPMPTSQKAKDQLNAKRFYDDKPKAEDVFVEGFSWAEFHTPDVDVRNKEQAKVDFANENQLWYYLGRTSTPVKAQYTEDPAKPRHNTKGDFIQPVPKPPKQPKQPKPPKPRELLQQVHRSNPPQPYGIFGGNNYLMAAAQTGSSGTTHFEKPYVYKPKDGVEQAQGSAGLFTTQRFIPSSYTPPASQPGHQASSQSYNQPTSNRTSLSYTQQRFELGPGQGQAPRSGSPHTGYSTEGQRWQNPVQPPTQGSAQYAQSPPSISETQTQQPPRQQANQSWQVHPSVYQKYQFFQVNHNRDSGKYRTPYSPWGGFTNGYEGNLKAHLMSKQGDLLQRSSVTTPMAGSSSQAPHSQNPVAFPAHASSSWPQTSPSTTSGAPVSGSPSYPGVPGAGSSYFSSEQGATTTTDQRQGESAQASSASASTAKPSRVGLPAAVNLSLKSTKSAMQLPSKESPVPLPPYVRAAMASSPKTQTSTLKPASPNSIPPTLTDNTNGATLPHNPSSATPATSLSISSVPVVTPQQAAAQMNRAETQGIAQTTQNTNTIADQQTQTSGLLAGSAQGALEFADVPGCGSMDFMERMIGNLRRVSRHDTAT